MSNKLSKEEIQEVIRLYGQGESGIKISKRYNISPTAIYALMRRRDIDRRDYREAGRVYCVNDNYFDVIDTTHKAYYLGLLFADGYNNEKRGAVTLILIQKDRHILVSFRDDIGSDKPILDVKNKNGSDTCRMEICSQRISQKLSSYGCIQAKTFKIVFPEHSMAKELYRHFIRGYFDGDGCISYTYSKRNNTFGNSFNSVVTFVSTESFCLFLKKYFKETLDINSTILCRNPSRNNNIRTLQISGSLQVTKLMEWMYKDADVYLHRKMNKFNDIREILNQRKRHLSRKVNKDTSGLITLSEIVKNSNERWNARYFITHNMVETSGKSLFNKNQADILRQKLNEYGDRSAIPDDIVDKEFKKAKEMGFPFYKIDKKSFDKTIISFKKANIYKNNDIYSWGGKGTQAASFFHPHMFNCKKKGKMSAWELYNDDFLLRGAIKKIVALYPSITESTIREILRNDKNSSRINNFPPRVAMSIIKDLYPEWHNRIKVLDPCAGFSGRLIGCACSGIVDTYTGIDISPKTFNGLLRTKEWLGECGVNINIINGDCLVEMPRHKEYDLILTSPPFLDVEQYDGVVFESNYKEWLYNFIEPFNRLAYSCLKDGGKMAIYIEKINSIDFPSDFEKIAVKYGFRVCNPVKFNMSYGENNRADKESRLVRVLVFSKD